MGQAQTAGACRFRWTAPAFKNGTRRATAARDFSCCAHEMGARRVIGTLIAVTAGILTLLAGSWLYAAGASNSSDKLGEQDRERLALALVKEESQARVLIVSKPGQNQRVAGEVKSRGGTVEYEADDVDYLRVSVRIEVAEAIARLTEVEAICVDGSQIYRSPGQPLPNNVVSSNNAENDDAPPAPGKDLPADNPYVAMRDIGAPQFIAKHPTFDGRGVTIGVVEAAPDILLPELQTAKDLEGHSVRKLAGFQDVEEPEDEADLLSHPSVDVQQEVHAEGGRFTYENVTYITPFDGDFRFGFWNSKQVAVIAKTGRWKDVSLYQDADGNPRKVAVLWDEQQESVWVDVSQKHDFPNEKPLRDFNVEGDVGVFGKDDPATPWRESIGFFVLLDQNRHNLRLELAYVGHTTATAICASGKGLFGSQANGVAPEARLYIVRGYGQHALIEGTLVLMRNPTVDVIWNSTAVMQDVNAGESVIPVVWSRMVSRYKKLIFEGASNLGPGTETVNEAATTSEVIAVGGYISKDTWWSNYALRASQDDYVADFSGRGPAANGRFKPDILAPVDQIVPHKLYEPGQSSPGGYRLPTGYFLCNGTSCAAPTAAGAAALLISAAKQTRISYDASRLHWAIEFGARFLDNFGAQEQGAGLINVVKSWELLQTAERSIEVTSSGPVSYIYTENLNTPGLGPSIYEREAWNAGDKGRRTIVFTRTSGPPESLPCDLRWVGNDGTYSIPVRTIDLPLNTPVQLLVTIAPSSSGIHSAILRIIRHDTSTPVYQVMTTVIASEELRAGNAFQLHLRGTVPPLLYKSWFIGVPQGTGALRIEGNRIPDGLILRAYPPWGVDEKMLATPVGHWIGTIGKPVAGVWEITLSQKDREVRVDEATHTYLMTRMPPQIPLAVDLTVSAKGISAISNSVVHAMENTSTMEFTVRLKNQMGEIKGISLQAEVGILQSRRVTLTADNRMFSHEIDVPPDSTHLQVDIKTPTQAETGTHLYLYDCTNKNDGCSLKRSEVTGNSEVNVLIRQPAPGKWVAVVDASRLPQGESHVSYHELMTHPTYGSTYAIQTPSTVAPGQVWDAKVTAIFKGRPTASQPAILLMIEDNASRPTQPPDSTRAANPIMLKTMTLYEKPTRARNAQNKR